MEYFKAFLALILQARAAYCCVEYYVKPENFSTTCPSQCCLTLNEYLQDPTMYFISDSTFTFLQGQHLLNQTMALSNVENITLRGAGIAETVISVDAGGAIMLNNCTEIEICSLKILYEGREKASDNVITSESSTMQISNLQFSGGEGRRVIHSDGFRLMHGTANFANCSFTNWHSFNGAALHMQDSNITFNGYFNAVNSTQGYGATLSARDSNLHFRGEVSLHNNIAFNGLGGTLFTVSSKVSFEEKAKFVNNSVGLKNGGGISCIASHFEFHKSINFTMNSANEGGGMHALDSNIYIYGTGTFLKNEATVGGGMVLIIATIAPEQYRLILHSPATVTFDGNRAKKNGAGLYIYNSIATQCGSQYEQTCFFKVQTPSHSDIHAVLKFVDNYAGETGVVIYGGYLRYCRVESNDNSPIDPLKFINISNASTPFLSDPNRIVLCDSQDHFYEYDNHTIRYKDLCEMQNDCTTIIATRGENFSLSVKAVGQNNLSVATTIEAYIEENDDDQQAELTPVSHQIGDTCTNITFKVFAKNATNILILHPTGLCSNNKKIINVELTPCPLGFKLKGNRCKCEGIKIIKGIMRCNEDTLQFERLDNSWIQSIEQDKHTGFAYHRNCPIEYCIPKGEVAFSLNDSDVLCMSNHSGVLCGGCRKGYSLTFNRFKCQRCNNSFLGLLLLFGFAGIALIATLLVLHMTVAAGTINGLILYANIVTVNSVIFFPQNHTHVLTAFISWLNLDFGIDTCFYDGLDFYAYAWLQYAFPVYLWFLIGMIIMSNKLSTKVGKLFGSNPVAVLATVTLMSYTKLLEAATLTLSYTYLENSNGERRKVWFFDGNVTYFKGKHGILSIVAICVIAFFLIPYFFLMLFGYRLQAYSGKRAFLWFNKLKPFLDAYYAPYTSTMRFWPGFMLLVRGSLYMVTALSNSEEAILIAISSVFAAIAIMPWLGYHIYEKLYNDILEASFILNISLLSVATFYVKAAGSHQENVTKLSISIVLLQFLGITCFHLSKNTKVVMSVLSKGRDCVSKMKLLIMKKKPSTTAESEESSTVQEVTKTIVELREPLLAV